MVAYLVVDTKIKNGEAYEEYKLRAKPIVESYGGEYLARGGNTTAPENELWTPTRLVVVRFPSRQNAEDFLNSDEYAPVKAIRNKNAETTMCIIDGI
jgi:uncharacterized protein (DUF1330 family)|tara:strand:- start:392 stop:682 length:291 start_codon:yes stop_codon:yes gene_type:complete